MGHSLGSEHEHQRPDRNSFIKVQNGNVYQRVMIDNGAHGNLIGGTEANDCNQISGNAQYGIWVSGFNATGNVILGNRIRTNVEFFRSPDVADRGGRNLIGPVPVTRGLSAANSADAALDNDGDGFKNPGEFVAGTDPNDGASRLAAVIVAEGNVQVSFPTVNGKSHSLHRSENLSGAWEKLATHIAGTGDMATLPVPVAASRGFFRVGVGF